MNTDQPNERDLRRTFVLLDPTAPHGEAGLEALDSLDTHISVVVLLSGRSSHALREFATVEGVDLATAGWIYTQSVVDRLAPNHRLVEAVVATGPNPAVELIDLVALHETRRVIVPFTIFDSDPKAARRIIDGLSQVTVASPVAV